MRVLSWKLRVTLVRCSSSRPSGHSSLHCMLVAPEVTGVWQMWIRWSPGRYLSHVSLTHIHIWHTTADLQEARALLDELACAMPCAMTVCLPVGPAPPPEMVCRVSAW